MENWFFDFTPEKLAQCVPHNKDPQALFQALEAVLPRYEINTMDRVAAFLAQCGHESADFNILQENLNYKAETLHRVWPRYFPDMATAEQYAHNQQAIANRAYSNRMGNGDESSGDGYKYRGRGAIQLTGHDNYKHFADSIGYSIDEAVAYTETLQGAIESAAWFLHCHSLNKLADDRDITSMTKKINGGTLGLEERKAHMIRNLEVFGA